MRRAGSFVTVLVALGCLLVVSTVHTKTLDRKTPAEEIVCDDLSGALFGLCNAYCEAMNCDSDVPQASDRACQRVLANFMKKSGGETLPICDTSAALGAIPFGPFGLPQEEYGVLFSGGVVTVTPDEGSSRYVLDTLTVARDTGVRLFISLASTSKRHYKNPDDTFNLDTWKARIDRYIGAGLVEALNPFIDDGTVAGHYLIDEPKSRGNWGGEIIPNDVLDEMARYSKQYWPNMKTAIRVSPTQIEEHAAGYEVPWPDWEWQSLDLAWAQYSARFGPMADYRSNEVASAISRGRELKEFLAPLAHMNRTKKVSTHLVAFLAEESMKTQPHERLVGSSEVIESVFGKLKRLEQDQAKIGFIGLVLSVTAMVSSTTTEVSKSSGNSAHETGPRLV